MDQFNQETENFCTKDLQRLKRYCCVWSIQVPSRRCVDSDEYSEHRHIQKRAHSPRELSNSFQVEEGEPMHFKVVGIYAKRPQLPEGRCPNGLVARQRRFASLFSLTSVRGRPIWPLKGEGNWLPTFLGSLASHIYFLGIATARSGRKARKIEIV